MIYIPWLAFFALILFLLTLDLGIFNRRPHAISIKEALGWTLVWIAVALVFNGLVYFMYDYHWFGVGESVGHPISGKQSAILFFTAYLVEKSLSLDNIFVMAMIFAYFRVPDIYQHRVLFWGILGALVMRGLMIGTGIAAIRRFEWLTYVFAAILVYSAFKMLTTSVEKLDPNKNLLFRLVKRFFPVTEGYLDKRFFSRFEGKIAVTPLFLTLIVVETTDVLFAVDSIPAVFSVTLDPFIVFTSNVFAILGLRSLYFVLAAMISRFRYLKVSLSLILAYVGAKMAAAYYYPIAPLVSLVIIAGILAVGILASIVATYRDASTDNRQ
jgi:tellurite resistance protein TerC